MGEIQEDREFEVEVMAELRTRRTYIVSAKDAKDAEAKWRAGQWDDSEDGTYETLSESLVRVRSA